MTVGFLGVPETSIHFALAAGTSEERSTLLGGGVGVRGTLPPLPPPPPARSCSCS